MWRDASQGYGPHKAIYNQFNRWSHLRVFNHIFAELADQAREPDVIIIDATHSEGLTG